MNQNEIIRRITQLSNKSYIPYCSIAEEAKKLKSDGEILEIHNGRLEFSGPVIGSNITETNNQDIENKADKEHTHTRFKNKITITNDTGTGNYAHYFESVRPNMVEGNNNIIHVGKEVAKYKSCYFGYKHSDTDPKINIGLHSADELLTIGRTKANFKPALTCDGMITATNIKADNETRLQKVETNKADKEHTHDDILDRLGVIEVSGKNVFPIYTSYTMSLDGTTATYAWIVKPLKVAGAITADNLKEDNETRLKTLEDRIINYGTFEAMKADWLNIPSPSTIYIEEGPEAYSSSIIFKAYNHRSLCLSAFKNERNYLYIRFQGAGGDNDWRNESGWRKIPILIKDDNGNENIVANNIKADNETRLQNVESNKADINHTHSDFKNINITNELDASNIGFRLKNTLLNLFYPVGAIYTSMNNTSPADLFGGSWTQITDRFLYCANSSMNTGGSKKISIDQLPAHYHEFNDSFYLPGDMNGYPDGWDDMDSKGGYWRYGHREDSVADTTLYTGRGEDYMPPYITVYAWYREA